MCSACDNELALSEVIVMGVMSSGFTPNVRLRDTLIQQIIVVLMFDKIDRLASIVGSRRPGASRQFKRSAALALDPNALGRFWPNILELGQGQCGRIGLTPVETRHGMGSV